MTVTYSDPQKNANINKSKAALVEIIDELRTRFARKNDAFSEAQAESDRRLALLKEWDEYRLARERPCPFCFEIKHTGYCQLAEEVK